MDIEKQEISEARLNNELKQVPYLQTDNIGRPELEAFLSSDQLVLQASPTELRLHGDVTVERSRWLRDAEQGVSILSFEDPNPVAPDPLPEQISNMELDLDLTTSSPLRVDNNVLKRFEGQAQLHLGGTLGAPEFAGTVDIESGQIDVAILGDAYEIDHGRVQIEREIEHTVVDVVAISTNPIQLDNQQEYITLHLNGPLNEIRWDCEALNDVTGELGTTRGCIEYVVFDAGDTEVAEISQQDVRQAGGAATLYTGKPLALASKLWAIQVSKYVESAVPGFESYVPHAWARVGQLGLEVDIESRPEWLHWGWGNLGFDVSYLQGYPGSLLRSSYGTSARLEILENFALEASAGKRNYSNRVLILDPSQYRSLEAIQSWRIPSVR